jgi:hypothetical protein
MLKELEKEIAEVSASWLATWTPTSCWTVAA